MIERSWGEGRVLVLRRPHLIHEKESEPEMKPLSWQPGQNLEELEREALTRTLEKFDGNKTRTAKALGVSYLTVNRKIRKLGIPAAGKARGRPGLGKNRSI
jgi:transcriptional regulator with PAS, ATPase and Fis domain